jgi:hypothetical protein
MGSWLGEKGCGGGGMSASRYTKKGVWEKVFFNFPEATRYETAVNELKLTGG